MQTVSLSDWESDIPNVGRVLALGSHPVVRHGFQKIRHEWINLFGVTVEQTGPIQRTKAIREFLSSRQMLDPEKRIFPSGIVDSVLLQFPGEPFMSVDVNLNLERKLCLQLDMHQPKITIDENRNTGTGTCAPQKRRTVSLFQS